jgi:hypothetical protein
LVVKGFQGGRIEKDRRAVLAAFPVEGRSDKVAHAAASVDVLRRKEPVIAAEVHTAA